MEVSMMGIVRARVSTGIVRARVNTGMVWARAIVRGWLG